MLCQILVYSTVIHIYSYLHTLASPVAQMVKNLPANAGDMGSIPGSGRSLGEGNGNLLQHYFLENSMDRGDWQITDHGVPKSGTRLSTHTHTYICIYFFSFSYSFPLQVYY